MKIKGKLETAIKESKKRNFTQTWDLIINLTNIDLSKPENRFSGNVVLPNKIGKEPEICIIADRAAREAKKLDVKVLTKKDLNNLDKRKIKSIASQNDYFLGEVTLMPIIGKVLGPVLGPRGKMPKPFPPDSDLEKLIEKTKKSFRVNVKSPVIQGAIGTEDMNHEEIKENIKSVLNFVVEKLPKKERQIKNVYIKLTMGKPVRIRVK